MSGYTQSFSITEQEAAALRRDLDNLFEKKYPYKASCAGKRPYPAIGLFCLLAT